MAYSIISALALILNLILNGKAFKSVRRKSAELENEEKSVIYYKYFLTIANCYFVADIAWGILYEYHSIDVLYPVLYLDCILYFLFMFMTMLAWMHYIVAYLDKKGLKSKSLLCAVWLLFSLGLIYLLINIFHPFIFSFNEKHEYIMEPGRHIAFILQIALYMVITIYIHFIAHKLRGKEKVRHKAVGFSCFVMDLFLMLQILNPKYPSYAMGLIIGICVIHAFVEAGEMKEKETYDQIATTLAEDFEAMYYVDIETGEYREFAKSREYESMQVPVENRDFYAETQANIEKYAHPDDREFAKNIHLKETIVKNLEERKSYSYKYRIMVGEQARYFQFTVMRANDGRHFILYEKDIDDEITAENMRIENQKKHVTFTQIAEILAVNFDVIYYVDAEDLSYISYECRNIYGQLEIQKSGDDFFADSKTDISNIVHKNDRELVQSFLNRDYIRSILSNQKSCSIDYRVVAFKQTHYVRMTVRKTENGTHYIIGIENIDDEVKKEEERLKALNTEKELARRDELTGVKNKTAYNELEKSVQTNIDRGMDFQPFALVVCDSNNLKKINDTEGHAAGDEYIKNSSKLLCNIFVHSPVFRVGGDEFVIYLTGNDYINRKKLLESLRSQVQENLVKKTGSVLASGMAEYDAETDCLVSEVFIRADKDMYKNKQKLKKDEKSLSQ